MYATEAYYTGPDSRLRRFTYRVDGFVSARASSRGGELVTRPLRFSGSSLVVNFRTEPEGSLRVELLDPGGKAIPGFELAGCPPLRGDEIEQRIAWNGAGKLKQLAERPIRIRFLLEDADLFSFRFR
jgi:hypothetical protein